MRYKKHDVVRYLQVDVILDVVIDHDLTQVRESTNSGGVIL